MVKTSISINLFLISKSFKYIILFKSNSGNQTADKKEHLYKILVIGELGTGKTSLIKRYVHNLYSPNYRATVSIIYSQSEIFKF